MNDVVPKAAAYRDLLSREPKTDGRPKKSFGKLLTKKDRRFLKRLRVRRDE